MSSFNTVVFDDTSLTKLQEFKAKYVPLETDLLKLTDSRDKLYALTHLEQSFMWLNKVLAREQEARNAEYLARALQAQVVQPQPLQAMPMLPQIPINFIPAQPLSPDAAILAQSTANMEELMKNIKELQTFCSV